MSVVKSLLLGLGGAAVVASGVAGTTSASAQTVAATAGACEHYAQEYAAVNTPRYGDWDTAYRFAYNECVTGGPDFVVAGPYDHYGNPYNYPHNSYVGGPLAAGAHVAGSALYAGANIAGTALHAGANIAGAALSIPGAILGGTASALAPQTAPVQPRISPTAEPVVVKNYRGTYEEPPVTAGVAVESTSALAVPTAAPEPFSPEWIAYCDAKYNSFNPETGMYLAYSGTYRMCN